MIIQLLSIAGFFVSLYGLKATYTEKPWCDISPNISCTKAFRHEKGKHFGVPNTVWGMIFYAVLFAFSFYSMKIVFWMALFSVLGSIYLAYELYFKVKSFCVVCTTIYLINVLLLAFA
ncbi:hypothetical protein HYS48_04500 [Candidatus Woesearchaeota archaeon]|nr:hypothetical protein [Candidatus Woesearchaeota archaeon]